MLTIIYTCLLGLMPLVKDPPVKLVAYTQARLKGKSTYEATMEQEVKKKVTPSSKLYLIWLVLDDLQNTKIVSVKINHKAIAFDTAHVKGTVVIADGLRMPKKQSEGILVQDSSQSSIRIYLKETPLLPDAALETIVVRYKQRNACVKKIRQTLKAAPASITQ